VTLFEKMPLQQALADNAIPINDPATCNQLSLQGF
jgi:hypothetical protein